jgi:hypothetical protein
MTDWNAAVIAGLDRLAAEPWQVIPGMFTVRQAVCGDYPTAGAAHGALVTAGFSPSARSVAAPLLAPNHDPRTVMRYSAGEGSDVLLVRQTLK